MYAANGNADACLPSVIQPSVIAAADMQQRFVDVSSVTSTMWQASCPSDRIRFVVLTEVNKEPDTCRACYGRLFLQAEVLKASPASLVASSGLGECKECPKSMGYDPNIKPI